MSQVGEQSNNVASSATALNLNALKQHADQGQGGGGILVQAIGQKAKNEQGALALSAGLQSGASNSSSPVAVGGKHDKYDKHGKYDEHNKHGKYDEHNKHGKYDRHDKYDKHDSYDKHDKYGRNDKYDTYDKGRGGSVTQSNNAASGAKALNGNLLYQGATQGQDSGRCGCSEHTGIQALGQSAKNHQGAFSGSLALQCRPSNGRSAGHSYAPQPWAYEKPREVSYC